MGWQNVGIAAQIGIAGLCTLTLVGPAHSDDAAALPAADIVAEMVEMDRMAATLIERMLAQLEEVELDLLDAPDRTDLVAIRNDLSKNIAELQSLRDEIATVVPSE